jgi:hypothetical protein
MALTFNHATKRIGVPQADAQPLLIQSLLNQIREVEASERGICYDSIATAAGKDDLGGGVQTGITLNLRSTWAIEFAAGAYQATITGGNLADALARVFNTGNPQVLINSSAAATIVTGDGGSTLTAAQVWGYPTRGLTERVDADVQAVNGVELQGAGTPADPMRPA